MIIIGKIINNGLLSIADYFLWEDSIEIEFPHLVSSSYINLIEYLFMISREIFPL